jgi:hypothetical protein
MHPSVLSSSDIQLSSLTSNFANLNFFISSKIRTPAWISETIRSNISQTMTNFSVYHSTICFYLILIPRVKSYDFLKSYEQHHILKNTTEFYVFIFTTIRKIKKMN